MIEKYANVHKEKIEDREKIFKTEIMPYLQQWVEKCPEGEKEQTQKLV